jgi:hypothetical protein
MLKKTNWLIFFIFILIFFLASCSGASQSPTLTATPSIRPTPWGPSAKITARFDSPLPCKLVGERCQEWGFTVTFISENNVGARVENLRMAFVSKENEIYAEGGFPTWFGVDIPIPANGSAQYQGKAVNPGKPDLAGGRMDFIYQGYDENGNKFSGKISATLTIP